MLDRDPTIERDEELLELDSTAGECSDPITLPVLISDLCRRWKAPERMYS